MQLLQILGFIVPNLFFIILFFFAEKKGAYLPIFISMFMIPLGIISNTLRHNINGQEYAFYAMFVVYMMGNFHATNKWVKIFALFTATCAVGVLFLDFYTRYTNHLISF